MAPVIDLSITKGKTWEMAFLYADDELVYREITGMPSKAPVRLAAVGHGLPDGWPVHICNVKAPAELNTITVDEIRAGIDRGEPLPEFKLFAKVVSADIIELNNMVALGWKPFGGTGGTLADQNDLQSALDNLQATLAVQQSALEGKENTLTADGIQG